MEGLGVDWGGQERGRGGEMGEGNQGAEGVAFSELSWVQPLITTWSSSTQPKNKPTIYTTRHVGDAQNGIQIVTDEPNCNTNG